MGGKAKLDWGLTIFKHIAKASATNDVLGVRPQFLAQTSDVYIYSAIGHHDIGPNTLH